MPPQININELYSIQKKKKQKRTVCFDKILELCHNRIKSIAESNGQNTFYEIPGILAGYPLYDLNECLEYIVDALRKNGFLVQILPKPHVAVIYISWDPEELKPPKPIKQVRPRQQIANQQQEYISSIVPVHKTMNTTGNNRTNVNYDNIEYDKNNELLIKPDHNNIIIKPNKNSRLLLASENTRTVKSEPFYLASLRLF
jgi:Family of unknown function (DUF5759)